MSDKKSSQGSPTKDNRDDESQGKSREITKSSAATPMKENVSSSEDETGKSKPGTKVNISTHSFISSSFKCSLKTIIIYWYYFLKKCNPEVHFIY